MAHEIPVVAPWRVDVDVFSRQGFGFRFTIMIRWKNREAERGNLHHTHVKMIKYLLTIAAVC